MCREWLNVHRRIVGRLLFKRCTKLKWECCFPQWLAIIKILTSMGNFFYGNWGVQKSLWFIVGKLNCTVKLCKAFLILEEFWWIYIFMKVVKCFHFLINPTMVLEELPLLSGNCDNKSFCSYCFTLQANHFPSTKIWGFIRTIAIFSNFLLNELSNACVSSSRAFELPVLSFPLIQMYPIKSDLNMFWYNYYWWQNGVLKVRRNVLAEY